MGTDVRFATNASRVRHRTELLHLLEACFVQKTATEWLEILAAEQIPCGPVNSISQALADKHSVAHAIRQPVAFETARQKEPPATVDVIANPVRRDGGQTGTLAAGGIPGLGAHTTAVLSSVLGYSAERIAELRLAGAVA